MMGRPSSNSEMIERALRGDRLALTILLAESEDTLRDRLAPRIPADLQSLFDVDDLLQEIHADVFRGIGDFQARGADSFDRWLAAVALRRLRMEIRRFSAAKRGGGRMRVDRVRDHLDESAVTLLKLLEAADQTPSRVAAGKEAVVAVQAALKELPDDYREAVRLVYLEGQPVAQAALALGRTQRAVHNLCYKAKRKLREMLGTRSHFLSSSE
jgi:RNA polymerase sigma factor (sigma-70 family)